MNLPNTCIVVCGPTAVGKTLFAIKLAQQFNTRIISADSRQCFKELNVGVAKPSLEELSLVHHYFINSHSIHDEVSAAVFRQYALNAANEIFAHNKEAVLVGGTGLYIKAFCEGLDNIPAIEETIRQQVITMYHKNGIEYLQQQLAEKDPTFWQQAEQQNPQRLMRALEVLLSTQQSITTFRKGKKEAPKFNIIKIGLQLPREQLYQQINNRVDDMIKNGLAEEVESLQPFQHLNALQTVGYTEIFEHLQNKVTLTEAIEKIKTNTRHYAKRQMTWFNKDKEIRWLHANNENSSQTVIKLL